MEATTENRSPGKLFGWIERVGNKVPNPFLLFVYLIVVLMVATAILSSFDVAVKNPTNPTTATKVRMRDDWDMKPPKR